MATCPDCGGKIASETRGPLMQVRCFGFGEFYERGGCGATWKPEERTTDAWNNFHKSARAATPEQTS